MLWTNPNPTQAFAPQTVSIDLTNYDAVDITFDRYVNDRAQTTHRIIKNGIQSVCGALWTQSINTVRIVDSVTNAGVVFNKGQSYDGSDNNNMMIPLQIVGIKYN